MRRRCGVVTPNTPDNHGDSVAARLSGGDRRSPGAAGDVAAHAIRDPSLVPVLVALLRHDDPLIRMRAADALEKVSRERPETVVPFAATLVREIGPHPQQEIRWHVALMLPRLGVSGELRDDAVALARAYLADRSRIVVAEAMTALAVFARDDPALREWLILELERFAASDVPSARSRAKRVLKELGVGERGARSP
jgi:HEAT repeat protein